MTPMVETCERCKERRPCRFYGTPADVDTDAPQNGEWLCDGCVGPRRSSRANRPRSAKVPKLANAAPARTAGEQRDERLAVNAPDLDRLDPATLARLLGGRLDPAARLDLRGGNARSTDVALAFACPLVEAALACDALRELDRRAGEPPTRVYVRRRGWSRLPGAVPLTTPDGAGGYALNPDVFPPVVTDKQLGALAPAPCRVKLGR